MRTRRQNAYENVVVMMMPMTVMNGDDMEFVPVDRSDLIGSNPKRAEQG